MRMHERSSAMSSPAGSLTRRAADLDSLPVGARLNTRDVMSLLNCSKSTLLRRLSSGRAPLPVEQGVWRAGDVRDWLNGEASA